MGRPKQKKSKKHKIHIWLIIARISCTVIVAVFVYWYFSLRPPKLPEPPLKDLAAAHGIKLGIHPLANRLSDKFYPNIVSSQYSFITVDGEVHFGVQTAPLQYDYTKADKLVSFAMAHNMPVQMHHLVWGEHKALPSWLVNGNYSKAQLLDILHQHINNVAGHYAGRVAEWSVANEIFSRAQHTYGLHDWWADQIGDMSYVDNAFKWAHQADPHAKLLLNDFNNEAENSISNAEYIYVKTARAAGVPIDGLGMQMHIDASNPPTKEAVIKNIQRFAALGVPTYVTEFDVNTNTVVGSSLYKNQLEAQVANTMVRACIESKACVSFDVFGVTDKESLFKRLTHADSHGYLLDSRFRPKPSFFSFRSAWEQP